MNTQEKARLNDPPAKFRLKIQRRDNESSSVRWETTAAARAIITPATTTISPATPPTGRFINS